MKLLKVTFAGYAGTAEDTSGRVGDKISINPACYISHNPCMIPAGTEIKTTLTDRNIVVSETMDQIDEMLEG